MVERFCPDTNFFLHARAPQELPWSDITQADSVELLIVDEVLEELDSRKHLGNQRVARRAKKLLEKLDPLFDGAEEVVLRESKPRVGVRLAPALPANRDSPHGLNLDKADGRILEQCQAVGAALGEEITFLTNDRRPFMTAQRLGLSSLRIPDTWLLAPEMDERDRELAKAQAEVRELRNRLPKLQLDVCVHSQPVQHIEGSLPRDPSHTAAFLEEAVELVEQRYPAADRAAAALAIGTTKEAWQEYEKKRAAWLAKVKQIIERHPNAMNISHGVFSLTIEIENLGNAPAEGVVMEVALEGQGLYFMNPAEHRVALEGQELTIPSPPARPTARPLIGRAIQARQAAMSASPLVSRARAPQPRDPTQFTWADGSELLYQTTTGTCPDFRHQVGVVRRRMWLYTIGGDHPPVGRLKIRCSVKNLPQKLERVFPIALNYEWRDSEDATRRMIHSS